MRLVSAALAAVLVAFVPVRAEGEWWEEVDESSGQIVTLNCGEIKNSNESHQYGSGAWVEYVAETRRAVNGFCPWIFVGVEAYVVNVAGSGTTDWDLFTASATKPVPVPSYGTWQTTSHHYRSWLGIFTYSNGTLMSQAEVEQEPGIDPDTALVLNDPYNPDIVSPIIVDAERNGFRLTSVEQGVLFDIDADGQLDRVAWTDAEGDDEFLALDRNGNGRIDDGSELFGNNTPVYPGTRITAANGFEALKFLEGPPYGRSVIDEVIDRRDASFARLRLWRDANHNGISEPDELRPLEGAGVTALETEYRTVGRRDRYGNEFRQRALVLGPNGASYVYDVWLVRQ